MEQGYDCCLGRDGRGRLRRVAVPAGRVQPGMYLRLIGGDLILAEQVSECLPEQETGTEQVLEILQPVWTRGVD